MPTPVTPEALSFYVPIARIDREKRIVEGVATSEAKDGHGTIFDYEASKAAFMQWQGNLREMHQPKAVGRAVEIVPDDEHKQIIVRARVSTGANDTWEKVLDGTLSGFSVGAKDGQWGSIERGGETVPLLQSYRMVELSLVDSASNPDANGLAIVRADGSFNEEMLDFSESDEPPAEPANATEEQRTDEADLERAGKRISVETQGAMHMMRDASISQARMAAQTCGCDDCKSWHDSITPSDSYSVDRTDIATIARALKAEITAELRGQLSPTVQRINALMARDAQRAETPDVTRRVDALSANMDKVLSLVTKIANQPVDGGPALRQVPGMAMDKTLATQAAQRGQSDVDILRRALEMGFTPPTTQEAQVALAAKLMPQR